MCSAPEPLQLASKGCGIAGRARSESASKRKDPVTGAEILREIGDHETKDRERRDPETETGSRTGPKIGGLGIANAGVSINDFTMQ